MLQEDEPTSEISGGLLMAAMLQRIAVDCTERVLRRIRRELDGLVDGSADEDADAIVAQPSDHQGSPAEWIDAIAQLEMSQQLHRHLKSVHVIGEETRETGLYRRNDIRARTDPLDGTKNALNLGSSYAVVLVFDVFSAKERCFKPQAGAIACSTGELVTWTGPMLDTGDGRVDLIRLSDARSARQTLDTGASVPILRLASGRTHCVASVASSPERRSLLAELPLRRFWVWTGAGNPIVGSLLLRGLAAVIEPRAVQLHDAAYLLPLELLGGTICDLRGRRINVKEAFADPMAGRTIGPFIAASNPGTVAALVG